jgi:hypothetical protein
LRISRKLSLLHNFFTFSRLSTSSAFFFPTTTLHQMPILSIQPQHTGTTAVANRANISSNTASSRRRRRRRMRMRMRRRRRSFFFFYHLNC